jgi:hypothetical protein
MPAATKSPPRFVSRTKWAEKMQKPGQPELVAMPPTWTARYGNGPLLIATPRLIEAKVRAVKKGMLTTIARIREELAAEHRAVATCPLTTGIFLRIVAEHAEEERAAGMTRVSPYWRVVKDDGSLNPKFPGGVSAHAKMLQAEGIEIVTRRGVPRVAEVERYLAANH